MPAPIDHWKLDDTGNIAHDSAGTHHGNVASGVAMINRGDWNAAKQKSVMLITAISPAHRLEVKLALKKQVEGAFVIGIGPSSSDGVRPVGRLIDVADAGCDNFSPESGGVINVGGRNHRRGF